jgi:intein-encoded DNA endonuclease-like protein
VGRQRINKTTLAYIAGFLDGDGSILLQFKPSRRYKFGFVVYPSVRFYQDSNNEKILYWIKDQIGYGYMHRRVNKRRNTAMSQYSIEGANQVKKY